MEEHLSQRQIENALAAALRLLLNSLDAGSMGRQIAIKAAKETLNAYDMMVLQIDQ